MNLVTTALLTTMLASFLNGEEMRERRNAKSLFPSRMVNSFKRPVSYEERQWYLKDTPISMNVKSAWQAGFTGKDILVAVVDDGVNMNHHDLKPKFNSKVSYDFLKNRSISTDYSPGSHGTMCAGIIAGGYDKSDCGVGVAYDAQIASIRLYDTKNKPTEELEEKAFSHNNNLIDIYSNSWGPGDPGWRVQGPGPSSRKALKEGTRSGRQGKGSIYVFSAGNGGMVGDSCAYNGYVNSIYTIAISAVSWDGTIPAYTESCAAIMAVTYGGSMFSFQKVKAPMVTTMGEKCTDDFPGTSGTAAMASGIIALALQANRDLTWRDVQHLIARSSKPIRPLPSSSSARRPSPSWKINAANLAVSSDLGFGLMDANLMVKYAKKWNSVPEQLLCIVNLGTSNSSQRLIPWSGKLKLPLKVDRNNCSIRFLEHMQVQIDLVFPRRGYLEMNSESPDGTVSKLLYPRGMDALTGFKKLSNWTVTSLHYWGENPVGEWNITIQNSKTQRNTRGGTYSKTCRNIVKGNLCATWKNHCKRNSFVIRNCAKTCQTCGPGRLHSMRLILYGTKEDPLAINPHVNNSSKEIMQFTPNEINERKKDIPIHGGYSQWGSWQSCSKSCGGGVQYRFRSCTNPPSANKDRNCEGQRYESRGCGIRRCQVDGGYSEWTAWSSCNLTCGGGIQSRSRSCTDPRPANGGRRCRRLGPAIEYGKCNTQPCSACENVVRESYCKKYSQDFCTTVGIFQQVCKKTCGLC